MANQGVFRFPGVSGVMAASLTRTGGVAPNVATLQVPPQATKLGTGDLTIEYGGTTIRLRDCRPDKVSTATAADGRTTWILSIVDRRWRWAETGQVSGVYTESARDLAGCCLDAMGEQRYDVSKMPTTEIDVDWDYERPAEALAQICGEVACEIILGLDDRVRVVPLTQRGKLPNKRFATSFQQTIDPPELPGAIVAVGGRSLVQFDFKLEPVGLELDGSILPIDRLSYRPKRGLPNNAWAYCDTRNMSYIKEAQARQLATQTVFRWYRIQTPIINTGVLARDFGRITDRNRVLPLENTQLERMPEPGEIGSTVRRPPWVHGIWYDNVTSGKPTNETDPDNIDLRNRPEAIYPYPFTVDVDRGIVQFANPVFSVGKNQVDDGTGGFPIQPADIRLRIASGIRDVETGKFLRYEEKRSTGGLRTKPRYEIYDDIQRQLYRDYEANGLEVDNIDSVRRALQSRIDAVEDEYTADKPNVATYVGFHATELSGTIRQVSYELPEAGVAMTRVAVETEELNRATSRRQREWFERVSRKVRGRSSG